MIVPEKAREMLSAYQVDPCTKEDSTVAIILVQPSTHGYLARADLLVQRFVDSKLVEKVVDFGHACYHTRFNQAPFNTYDSLLVGICSSIGGLLLINDSVLTDEKLMLLRADLDNRLSYTWIMKTPIFTRTLAIVEGGFNLVFRQRVFNAAKALGIRLVVLDGPDHWLRDPTLAHLIQEFIPIDSTVDEGLPNRIVTALRGYKMNIEGITSFTDSYLVPTAQAAKVLGLPSPPALAFLNAVDKCETRKRTGDPSLAIPTSESEDLHPYLSLVESKMEFPLIVKPSRGGGSEGVLKVHNCSELSQAVQKVALTHPGTVLVEQYVDGPEVDANFVLLNDQILFSEVADAFPCSAETSTRHLGGSFLETSTFLPSGLNKGEIDLIRSTLHRVLLKLGFRSGVFHIEARVRNSAMQYVKCKEGITDLIQKSPSPSLEPSAFIIEVNARCPGFQSSSAAANVYGIDYYGLQMLIALQDHERAIVLSTPFSNSIQYWSQLLFIPATRGGVFASGNIWFELKSRRPDLAQYLSNCQCFYQRGDVIPDPTSGILRWIGSCLVRSEVSRTHALELAQTIEKEVRYELQ
ncbi:hypothetical protein BGZ60DRAFT_503371 [Tricladium varicosporioides]|nr:hypothetical protein BGZ60DRAFT_503371 [Hymenoscyphus varicosporioides]